MARDLSRAELYELWQRNKDRPQFVREYRASIDEHTTDGVTLPPPDGSTHAYRQFLNDSKGTVTRQLGESDTGEEGDE
jgi:hypothetical protein